MSIGRITNPHLASREIDYSGVAIGDISPTDIDGWMEYHNKAHVLIELKFGNGEMKKGQRLGLERITRHLSPFPAILFVAVHHDDFPHLVEAGNAVVVEWCRNGTWGKPTEELRLSEAVKRFIKAVDDGKYST